MRGMRTIYLTSLLLSFFLYSQSICHQDKKLTIHKKNVTWESLLQEIETQSGYLFSFDPLMIKYLGKVSFDAKEETLPDVLNRLFKSTNIGFSIVQQHIILKQKPQTIRIKGYITNKSGTEKLARASVMELNSKKGLAATEEGIFLLEVPAGEIILEISYIGYQRYRKQFESLTKDTLLHIQLEDAGRLKEVVVTGIEKSPIRFDSPRQGTYIMGKPAIERIPVVFGEADIVKVIQTLPGVNSGIEGLAGMYVRGGIGDDNLFLIDGIPIYEVNHLGGLFSPFNIQILDKTEFYKSGFPARYGSRLSSVVDIAFKEGNPKEFHGTAMLGLTSGSLQFEGPLIKDKTFFNASFRRSWLDMLSAPTLAIINKNRNSLDGKLIARYAFQDLNVRIDQILNQRNKLYITGYWSSDFLKGGREYNLKDLGMPDSKDISKLRWGNFLLAGGWKHTFNQNFASDLKISYTSYSSRLNREYVENNESDKDTVDSGINQYIRNGIKDISLRNDYIFTGIKKHQIRFGGHYTYHQYTPESKNRYYGSRLSKDYFQQEETKGHEFSLYAEDNWEFNKNIHLSYGGRLNHYRVDDSSFSLFEPRITTIFKTHKNIDFQASYSRMSQYVHQFSESHISLPTDSWLPSSRYFKPQISDQVSAGATYTWCEDYEFSIEGYYKWMRNILDIKDDAFSLPAGYRWENKLTSGKGHSYGLEFMAQRNVGRLNGWFSYSLMWAKRKFNEINKGNWFPAKYDNRHKINLTLNYKLKKNVEMTGSWQFMTGNRVTIALESYEDLDLSGLGNLSTYYDMHQLGYIDKRNNIRLPAYHRLDLGINFYRPKKNGKMGIWNMSIYNVYSRLNPIAIERKEWYNGYDEYGQVKRYVQFRTIGLFPIIPSVSYTYKF